MGMAMVVVVGRVRAGRDGFWRGRGPGGEGGPWGWQLLNVDHERVFYTCGQVVVVRLLFKEGDSRVVVVDGGGGKCGGGGGKCGSGGGVVVVLTCQGLEEGIGSGNAVIIGCRRTGLGLVGERARLPCG